MKTSKQKSLFALCFFALTFTFQSCDKDDDEEEASSTITFDDVTLSNDQYFYGQDRSGDSTGIDSYGYTIYANAITSSSATFYGSYGYNASYEAGYWSGFAVSALADSSVSGDYTNDMYLYAAASTSNKYAIAYGDGTYFEFDNSRNIESLKVANTTYTYKVLANGNSIAKKFSNESDYFTVTFKGYDNDGKETGTKTVYLAEGTKFVSTWTEVDLTNLGKVKKVAISFDSSDTGDFGINTPTYVAIDDITYKE